VSALARSVHTVTKPEVAFSGTAWQTTLFRSDLWFNCDAILENFERCCERKFCAASYKIQCLSLTMLYATAISLIVLIFLLQNYYDLWVNSCKYHHLLHIRKLQYGAFVSCDS